ncbi:MAG: PLDc N-terminal domain-containing protein [Anaerolineaceae bacterium]|nr:PLDc N-terminal domain-containing protein [Anaerolineaceae bacterium]
MSIVGVVLSSFNILLVLAWIVLTIVTLFQLKDRPLSGTNKVLWVMVVCCIPILGAIAFFIIQPAKEGPTE